MGGLIGTRLGTPSQGMQITGDPIERAPTGLVSLRGTPHRQTHRPHSALRRAGRHACRFVGVCWRRESRRLQRGRGSSWLCCASPCFALLGLVSGGTYPQTRKPSRRDRLGLGHHLDASWARSFSISARSTASRSEGASATAFGAMNRRTPDPFLSSPTSGSIP